MRKNLDRSAWDTPANYPERAIPHMRTEAAWHYTNLAGLEGMLTSNSLWATSSKALNDMSEVSYGIEAVQSYWDKDEEALITDAPKQEVRSWLWDASRKVREMNIFFFSACDSDDSLGHWQHYARAGGVALGFDVHQEFRLLAGDSDEQLWNPQEIPAIFWRRVQYGDEPPWGERVDSRLWNLRDSMLDVLAMVRDGRARDPEIADSLLFRQYIETVCFQKHPAFHIENEIRLMAVEPPGGTFTRSRDGTYGPTEYLTLAAASGDNLTYSTNAPERLPVVGVRVFPGPDAKSQAEYIRGVLDANGHDSVPVEVSALPYRAAIE